MNRVHSYRRRPTTTNSKPLHIFYPRVDVQTQYAEQVINALKLKNNLRFWRWSIDNETSLSQAWQDGADRHAGQRPIPRRTGAGNGRCMRPTPARWLVSEDRLPVPGGPVDPVLMFLINRDPACLDHAQRRAAGRRHAGSHRRHANGFRRTIEPGLARRPAGFRRRTLLHRSLQLPAPALGFARLAHPRCVVDGQGPDHVSQRSGFAAGRPPYTAGVRPGLPNGSSNQIDATLAASPSSNSDRADAFRLRARRNSDEQDAAARPRPAERRPVAAVRAVGVAVPRAGGGETPAKPLDLLWQGLRLRAAREREGGQVRRSLPERVRRYSYAWSRSAAR